MKITVEISHTDCQGESIGRLKLSDKLQYSVKFQEYLMFEMHYFNCADNVRNKKGKMLK